MSESPGERRLTAEEVNRLASELDGQPFHAEPVDDDSNVGRIPPAHEGVINDLNASEADDTVFPPGLMKLTQLASRRRSGVLSAKKSLADADEGD